MAVLPSTNRRQRLSSRDIFWLVTTLHGTTTKRIRVRGLQKLYGINYSRPVAGMPAGPAAAVPLPVEPARLLAAPPLSPTHAADGAAVALVGAVSPVAETPRGRKRKAEALVEAAVASVKKRAFAAIEAGAPPDVAAQLLRSVTGPLLKLTARAAAGAAAVEAVRLGRAVGAIPYNGTKRLRPASERGRSGSGVYWKGKWGAPTEQAGTLAPPQRLLAPVARPVLPIPRRRTRSTRKRGAPASGAAVAASQARRLELAAHISGTHAELEAEGTQPSVARRPAPVADAAALRRRIAAAAAAGAAARAPRPQPRQPQKQPLTATAAHADAVQSTAHLIVAASLGAQPRQ